MPSFSTRSGEGSPEGLRYRRTGGRRLISVAQAFRPAVISVAQAVRPAVISVAQAFRPALFAIVALMAGSPAFAQSVSRFSVESVVGVDSFGGENVNSQPQIVIDISQRGDTAHLVRIAGAGVDR